MAYGQDRGFAPRQLHDVSAMNLKCADCSVDIKELPFQPSTDRPVYCRDCNKKRRASFGPSRF
jgi:CxxC-x17-CxxC domain-containing protein